MVRSIKLFSAVIAGVLAGCDTSYESLDSQPASSAIERPVGDEVGDEMDAQPVVPSEPPTVDELPQGIAGQGADDEPVAEPNDDSGFAVDVLDCATDLGYQVNRREGLVGGTELHVLTIYESSDDHSFGYHPTGEAQVEVTRSAPVILVLSSYEPTHWTVSGDGAQIELVILNGYHAQTLTIAEGVAVIDRSGEEEGNVPLSPCSYGEDGGGCDTPSLISGAEAIAGEPMTSLVGCYQASSFTVGDATGDVVADPTEPYENDDVERDCASNERTPFELTTFARPDDELSCDGEQYVAYLVGHDLYLGVQLCGSPTTYRLYLAGEANGPFAAATDYSGHGQDQCELLNPDFTIPIDDDITSGGCFSCETSSNLPIEGLPTFTRGFAGECFDPIAVTGAWSYQTSRLSCGVSVP